jgi:hypothetical protein
MMIRTKSLALVALATIVPLVSAGPSALAATTLWDFNNDLSAGSGYLELNYRDAATEAGAYFWNSDGIYLPHIGGTPITCLEVPTSGENQGLFITRPGDVDTLTAYTFLFDVFVPQTTFDGYSYHPFFNTNMAGQNDAELFIDLRDGEDQGQLFADRDSDNGKVWTGGNPIQPNTWHRVAFAYDVDHASEDVRIFVDGVKIGVSDTEFGDYSFTIDKYIPVFQDGGFPDNCPVVVSAMAFVDSAMDDAAVTALGAPTADGFASIADPGAAPTEPPAGSSAYADAVLATSPAVYMRLNDAYGKITGDVAVNDGSLGDTITTQYGLPGYDSAPTSGLYGPNSDDTCAGLALTGFEGTNRAAYFDANTAGSCDMLNLDNPTVLDTDASTIPMWFNTTQETDSVRLSQVNPNFENQFSILMDEGKLVVATGTNAGTAKDSGDALFNDGEWHHMVAVRQDDDAANLRLFVDGAELTLVDNAEAWGASYSYRIGTRGTGSNGYIGLMDEVAIWERALSEAEAIALFAAATGGAGPVDDLEGDLDGDGFVGSADLDIVRGNWGMAVTGAAQGDPSGDGMVGSADLDIVRANWGAGTPPAAAVPEPGLLGLFLLGGMILGTLRRRDG